MTEKHARLAAGGQNPFVDPRAYRAYVAEREEAFLARLAQQKGGGAAEGGAEEAVAAVTVA